ncbi:TadA family conjugal transfer-associated ATPase [Paeniglutamicibacter sp. NPDC012692]|uniref:TadA family conjugal transfer-associated ATPase n=1 Tax=Paeniglutamicibacter sp. NPDC012692 TaxID=3364388 RepID=UPI0036C394C7
MSTPERRTGRRRWEQGPEAGQAVTSPEVLEQVRLRALGRDGGLSEVDLASAVQATGSVIGSRTTTEMVQNLSRDIHGLGLLEEFARQPGVTDVLVDGQGRIWVDGAEGLKPSGSGFSDPAALRALAVRFAAAAGRRLDDAQPFVDLTLGNYRVHAVLPPISTGGTLISVRVKRTVRPELAVLIDPARPDWLQALRAIVAARLNFLVSGGTGAGKTTLLAAMLAGVPANERIIVVEDSAELTPQHPHLIGLQARGGNVEGAGEVGLNMLVRQSLRMRPDRLVVGECRGAEIGDFLGAMNTGHEGAAGTVHANSVQAVPARLLAMGALAKMDPQATTLQTVSALDLLIHVARDARTGVRHPVQLGRLVLNPAGTLEVQVICELGAPAQESEALDWFRGRLQSRGAASPW